MNRVRSGRGSPHVLALLSCAFLTSCVGEASKLQENRADTARAGHEYLVDVVYTGLDLPASLEFVPDGELLILERGFTSSKVTREPRVKVLNLKTGQLRVLSGRIPATSHNDYMSGNQGGAVGLALDPQYTSNHLLYLCYHHRASNGKLDNRLSSFTVQDERIEHETVLVDRVPGDETHNGCRIAIDNDGMLFLSTGSLEPFGDALDLSRLSGKILRVTRDGRIPSDNPYPHSLVWSYGHRNPQGLVFDSTTNTLWSTEHGESSADELNRIERGANYGWPACRGSAAVGESFRVEAYWADRLKIVANRATCHLSEPHASRYRPAIRTYYPDSTVGISDLTVYRGAAFPAWRGSLLITMLKGQKLVRVEISDGSVRREDVLIDGQYGRLRDVTVGPDGFIYVVTNEPTADRMWKGGSRLLRIRPATAQPTVR